MTFIDGRTIAVDRERADSDWRSSERAVDGK